MYEKFLYDYRKKLNNRKFSIFYWIRAIFILILTIMAKYIFNLNNTMLVFITAVLILLVTFIILIRIFPKF